MLIYIIGFMGSGKSMVAKKLARSLGYCSIDLDDYIEKKYLIKIPDLFRERGEAEFRKLEQKCLQEISELNNTVVSTGGGTPCNRENFELIKKTGFSIYLDASPVLLADRLQNAKTERPLLQDYDSREDLLEFIENKLAERKTFYEKADLKINAASVDIDKIISGLNELVH